MMQHYTPTVGYVLLIPTMTGIYSKWVKILTDWEMHRTDASWEYSYTQKIFIANFLVGYLSLVSNREKIEKDTWSKMYNS
ncbi:MAG: anoctamin [Paenibacillus sp.]|nr:anoctamin [Paenibacillus sp.]